MTPPELRAWREKQGFSQQQLGAMIGKSRQAIINWEKGRFAIPDLVALHLVSLDVTSMEPEQPKSTPEQRREAQRQSILAIHKDTWGKPVQAARAAYPPNWRSMTENEKFEWINKG